MLPTEKRGFGMVFQNYALFPHMTVYGNIAFGLELQRRPAAEIRERVRACCSSCSCRTTTSAIPRSSRAASSSASRSPGRWCMHPRLLLLDEPLSNLDAKLRIEMRAEIKRIHAGLGLTCIYVTHDQTEALSLSDWVVVMRDGIVMQAGPPQEIYNRPDNVFVADFMGFRNFFSGRGRIQRGGWASRGRERRLAHPRPAATTRLRPAQPATAAIRPEDVQVGGDAAGATSSAARSRSSSISDATTRPCCTLDGACRCGCTRRRISRRATRCRSTFPADKVIFLLGRRGAAPLMSAFRRGSHASSTSWPCSASRRRCSMSC